MSEVQTAPPPEAITGPEQEPSFEDSVAFAERLEDVFDSSEFEVNEETAEAYEGFYGDHYSLVESISGMEESEGPQRTPEEIQEASTTGVDYEGYFNFMMGRIGAGSESGDFKPELVFSLPTMPSPKATEEFMEYAQARLHENVENGADEAQSGAIMDVITAASAQSVFAESSIGITTLDEHDISMRQELIDNISEKIASNPNIPQSSRENLAARMSQSENILMEAQQEFWADTRMAGQLEVHVTTNLDQIYQNGASLLPRTEQQRRTGRFNQATMGAGLEGELHTNVPHFSERYDPRFRKLNESGNGIILKPLADIVEDTPFARDAEYSVQSATSEEVTQRVTQPDHVGSGQSLDDRSHDKPGEGGDDRVFFASPVETGEVAPDEYGVDLGEETTVVIVNGDTNGEVYDAYARGQNFPRLVGTETADSASTTIAELQSEKLIDPKYAGKIVVPLRRGVFDHSHEGSGGLTPTSSDGLRPRRVSRVEQPAA